MTLKSEVRILTEHNSDGTHTQIAATTLQGKTGWYAGPTIQVSAAPYPANPGTSRALNTVYQNLTGKPLWVNVWGAIAQGTSAALYAYVDSNSNPTTIVHSNGVYSPSGDSRMGVSMIVLPNYYYKVTSIAVGINTWTEWY